MEDDLKILKWEYICNSGQILPKFEFLMIKKTQNKNKSSTNVGLIKILDTLFLCLIQNLGSTFFGGQVEDNLKI